MLHRHLYGDAYTYSSIPQRGWIRLLKLDKDGASPIRGTLISTAIDAAPPFYALSYCWGTQGPRKRVLIDGKLLRVTPWLHSALKILNRPDHLSELAPKVAYLWIDQLCINQQDLDERAAQVEQMNLIYGSSVRTLVWLLPRGLHDWTVDLLKKTYRLSQTIDYYNGGVGSFSADAAARATMRSHGIPHKLSWKWIMPIRAYRGPWPQRLWVVQEVVLSPQDPIVLIGRNSLPFEVFAGLLEPLGSYLRSNVIDTARPLLLMQQLRKEPLRRTLDVLCMTVSSPFLSTDRRDMIYAIFGLSESCPDKSLPALDLRVDYDRTTTAQEVYRRFVRAWIMATGDLDILSLAMTKDSYLDKLEVNFGHELAGDDAENESKAKQETRTSWIPDFPNQKSPEHLRAKLALRPSSTGGAYRMVPRSSILYASEGMSVKLQPSDSTESADLVLSGLQVDTVAITSEILYKPLRPEGAFGNFNHFISLLSDQWYVQSGAVSRRRFRRDRRTWFKLLPFYSRATNLHEIWRMAAEHATYEDVDQLLDAFLFCTTGGYIGDCDLDILERVELRRAMIFALNEQSHKFHQPVSAKLQRANARVRELFESYSADARSVDSWFEEAEFDETYRDRPTLFYQVAANVHCSGLRFFVTKDGRLGTGSPATKAGDALVVLFGGKMPYTLRRRTEPSGSWQFLGQSWVYTLADGQAIDEMRAGRLQEQVFTLR